MCLMCALDVEYGMFGLGGRRSYGGYGGYGSYDLDGPSYGSFNLVSDRALAALDNAKKIFLHHLATVDVSKGSVTAEIIDFHLVAETTKSFRAYVKGYGCSLKQRKLTREEQDKINKGRQSLMNRTSVTVTAAAQDKYIKENPTAVADAKKKHDAHTAKASSSSVERVPMASISTNILASSSSIMANVVAGQKRTAANMEDEGPAKKRKSI